MLRPHVFLLACLSLAALAPLSGCAQGNIPNTDVPDNAADRQVIAFVENYRKALEARDVAKLMSFVSHRYFDDNGTPTGSDDIDYDTLRQQLASWHDQVLDVRYEIRYRHVTFRQDRVLVDFTYSGNFRIATADGDHWARRLSDDRLVLTREGGQYRILSGM